MSSRLRRYRCEGWGPTKPAARAIRQAVVVASPPGNGIVDQPVGRRSPGPPKKVVPRQGLQLTDSHRFYLLVKAGGSKLWKWSYVYDRTQKTMHLGIYPLVSLLDARAKRGAAGANLAVWKLIVSTFQSRSGCSATAASAGSWTGYQILICGPKNEWTALISRPAPSDDRNRPWLCGRDVFPRCGARPVE